MKIVIPCGGGEREKKNKFVNEMLLNDTINHENINPKWREGGREGEGE